uniref:Elongation factor 2 n=1 Tax=Arcella intermedia TaxID=1963864 RepID=A0A6B2KY08_9EUKA
MMGNPENVRNMCIVGSRDHGKSTLTDYLLTKHPLHIQRDREIPFKIHTSVRSLYFPSMSTLEDNPIGPFLINLIQSDSINHNHHDVIPDLQIIDGVLLVVDALEGMLSLARNRTLLNVLMHHIKVTLMINKLDRLFIELQSFPDDIHMILKGIVSAKEFSLFEDEGVQKVDLDPVRGNVVFGSAKHGWGFTLSSFATLYASKFGVPKEKLVSKLWGDHYFNPQTKQWQDTPTTQQKGVLLSCGFVQFILKPISTIINTILSGEPEKYNKILKSQGITLSESERQLCGMPLYRVVLSKLFSLTTPLREMMVLHLPSPIQAQKYRIDSIYTGPMDDECAMAIRKCDKDGPLMILISRIIPVQQQTGYMAFGRVFSGTVTPRQKVRVLGPSFNKRKEMTITITEVDFIVGNNIMRMDGIPAGNLVALPLSDNLRIGSCTLSSATYAHPFRMIRYSTANLISVSIQCLEVKYLPKLVESLKKFSAVNAFLRVETTEPGELLLKGDNFSALKKSIKILKSDYLDDIEITTTPFVQYRETVSQKSPICLETSPNRHNRLWITAEPTIIDSNIFPTKPPSNISMENSIDQDLYHHFNWNIETTRIWQFNAEGSVLTEETKGVQFINEVKDSVKIGFSMVSREGPLCAEETRGIRFNIHDITLHSDAIHRGGGQIITTARRAFNSAMLAARPKLLEPINLVQLVFPEKVVEEVYVLLDRARGFILEEQSKASMVMMDLYVPVLELENFEEELQKCCLGEASYWEVFSHWEGVKGDPLEVDSKAYQLVLEARKRKGLIPLVI